VVLLDSLHAGHDAQGRLEESSLAPFVAFARKASEGGPLFYVTHSAVPTPDYASTTETAAFLLKQIGALASPTSAYPDPSDPFRLTRIVDQGHFHVRGFAGADRDAHCQQLRLLPSILRDEVLPVLRR
jgi:hypothetical protein